jgi:hypothetical protein
MRKLCLLQVDLPSLRLFSGENHSQRCCTPLVRCADEKIEVAPVSGQWSSVFMTMRDGHGAQTCRRWLAEGLAVAVPPAPVPGERAQVYCF